VVVDPNLPAFGYEGKGDASKNVNGVDIWLVGTPLRKFKIIGYITDSRPAGPATMAPATMAGRDADLAAIQRLYQPFQ